MFSTTLSLMSVPQTDTLMERAQAGDSDAFCEICRAHETRLLRQAHSLCGDSSQAEDLAQETLVEAWKSLRRYNNQCLFFTWLCAILLNRYKSSFRAHPPIAISTLSGSDQENFRNTMENLADSTIPPDQTTEDNERRALIRQCIDDLPEKQRQVIYLRFYVDDSLDSIAAALGCSVGTVKSRLFNALERLRTMKALHSQILISQSEVVKP